MVKTEGQIKQKISELVEFSQKEQVELDDMKNNGYRSQSNLCRNKHESILIAKAQINALQWIERESKPNEKKGLIQSEVKF